MTRANHQKARQFRHDKFRRQAEDERRRKPDAMKPGRVRMIPPAIALIGLLAGLLPANTALAGQGAIARASDRPCAGAEAAIFGPSDSAVFRAFASDSAFLRAISRDDAVVATRQQVRQAADGLAGYPKDGVIGAVEKRTLINIADAEGVSNYTHNLLVKALDLTDRDNTCDLAIPQRPQSRGRIPAFMHITTLAYNASGADYGIYRDANGNRMGLWFDEQSPTQLSASFVRSGGDPLKAPRIRLTEREADFFAPQLARSQLAKARSASVPNPMDDSEAQALRDYGAAMFNAAIDQP
ncbi:MAG: hypothetical protein LBV50_02540 [Novosphingobium sp.]|jgi:hypothetical protein|nr:hypothetical protein [Novosphingobium sp.]